MPFTDYDALQTTLKTWMARADITDEVAEDCITLAEARLNRELEVVETDVTLTGTASSRTIDVSAYSIIEPMVLYFVNDAGDEQEVEFKAPGTFPYRDDNGEPAFVALNGTNLKFDCPLDQAYSFRFRYRGRFALSDSATTNDLLTNHPDVYLSACIMWSGIYIKAPNLAAPHKILLDEFISSTKSHLAQRKRGTLSFDPALAPVQNDTWWRQGT